MLVNKKTFGLCRQCPHMWEGISFNCGQSGGAGLHDIIARVITYNEPSIREEYIISEKFEIPESCPYKLEHLMANQQIE